MANRIYWLHALTPTHAGDHVWLIDLVGIRLARTLSGSITRNSRRVPQRHKP